MESPPRQQVVKKFSTGSLWELTDAGDHGSSTGGSTRLFRTETFQRQSEPRIPAFSLEMVFLATKIWSFGFGHALGEILKNNNLISTF